MIQTMKDVINGITIVKAMATLVVTLTIIIGSMFAFDSRYAHAGDVQKILEQQSTTLQVIQKHQKTNVMFQLEYYDSAIKRLEEQERQYHEKPTPTKADDEAHKDVTQQRVEMQQRKNIITKQLLE
jgi:biopolymer transport protein ExbB/TolQ